MKKDFLMRRENSGILIIVFSILLLGFLLVDYDFAQTGKEEPKSAAKVEYLGSVPMKSSLTELVPDKDKEMIGLKERWLESETNRWTYPKTSVSEDGRYKVVKTRHGEEMVEATFVDTNGAEIWSAVVVNDIYVSNNGKNIAVVRPLSEEALVFYNVRTSEVRTSSESPWGGDFHPENAFSHNGEYFISAGAKLIFYRADGTLIWKKDTGSKASKKVAISADGSYIVMASSGEPEPNITEIMGVEEEKQRQHSYPLKSVREERREEHEAMKKRAAEKGDPKTPQEAKSSWKERKVYLSFLKGDGSLINQATIRCPRAQDLEMSLDGKYAVISCNNTLLFYQTETGTLLWRKTFPTVTWWMPSVTLSWNGDIIALGVRPDRTDRYSPPHLYLLSKDGSEVGNFQLEPPPPRESPPPRYYQWGPWVTLTEDDGYILVATYTRTYLFKITEVDR
jgi:hypothetical protein